MLIEHPKIYLDVTGATTDALLIEDGAVRAIGDEARNLATRDAIRPDGVCVFPALTDAHIHLWGLGLRAGAVSFRDVTTTQEIYRLIAEYDLGASPSGWVIGKDWDQHHWEDAKTLDIDLLDTYWPDVPVSLRRVDGHALWVNSEALRRAGITESWDPGEGGHLGRRPDGRLSGLLVDDAMNPVLEATPEPGEVGDQATFLETSRLLNSFGITCAHKAWMPVDRLPMLERLRDADELTLRLHMLFDANDPGLSTVLHRGPWRDRWLSATGMKFFHDGALGSSGALLLDTYPDGTRGLEVDDRETLLQRVPHLAHHGWQVAIHGIGDAAARHILDAFERIPDAIRTATRPRLEHVQMIHSDDVERLGTLGVIGSIQAIHMYSDASWADEVLNETQLERLFRWRDIIGATTICGGSDFPIDDPNPWHGIATSTLRRDRKGRLFNEDQRLTRREALGSYTEGAAYAAGWETWLGQLKPGFAGDFTVLDRDPFDATAEEIWDMEVQETWIAGKRIHTK